MILHASEVTVVLNTHGIINWKTSKSVVFADLVLVCHLDSTLGHNVAVILNSGNCELKTIELCEVTGDKACVGVLFFCAGKGVLLFYLLFDCLSLSGFSLLALWLSGGNVDVDLVGFASEHALYSVEGGVVLVIKGTESLEFEIGGWGPVETLFRELVLIGVGDTNADVVVVFDAFDAAPEE